MRRSFSLEYWIDDGWYVGRLKEVPGVFSQGETLEELEANIRDAYVSMTSGEAEDLPLPDWHIREVERRRAAAEADPGAGIPWEIVKARLADRS